MALRRSLGMILLLLFAGSGAVRSQKVQGEPVHAEGAVQSADLPRPLLRTPTLHGDSVAFNCEGDIWVGDLKTGKATRLTRSGQTATPLFSPDGKQIAFAAAYDGSWETYVIPTEGGAPRRLTYLNRYASPLAWTPDGKSLLFRAPAPQGKTAALYRIAAGGGFPELLPLETVSHAACAPDGSRIVFTRIPRAGAPWFRYEGGKKNDIWVGELPRSAYRKIYSARYTCEYPVWVGERVAFVADEGVTFSVLSVRPDGSDLKRLAGPFTQEIRSLNSDGKRLVYERAFGLEMVDPATRKALPVAFQLHSDLLHTRPGFVPATQRVVGAQIGPTGKRVLVETRGQIVTLPTKEGEARVLLAKEGVRFRAATLSPDAKQLAYLSDETNEQQLYIADADGGHPRALTTDVKRQLKTVAWSPDSRRIALTDSEKRLRLIETQTGKETLVARGLRYDDSWDGPEADFSPDSRWIVYSVSNNTLHLDQIVLYEIATGTRTTISTGAAADFAPTFSPDGKWIAFLSGRSLVVHDDPFLNQISTDSPNKAYLLALQKETLPPFLPKNEEEAATLELPKPNPGPLKPVKTVIDLEGLAGRFIEIPVPAAYYAHIAMAGDRVLLGAIRPENLADPLPRQAVTYYDLKEKKAGLLAENTSKFQVSADGKKLLLYNGEHCRVVDATAEHVGETDGKLDFANLQLWVAPTAEWRNEYWEAWRLIRDYFYVSNMHGVDWPEMGRKYAALLPSVRSRDELNDLIRWLLAELSVSHAGVYGGNEVGVGQAPAPRASFLGIDVAPDASGYYRITRILHGDNYSESERSPLAAPGLNVKPGDFLIEVAGVPARADQDFQRGLVGRAGQVISLRVNDRATSEGARTLRIRPIADEGRIRYLEWVQDRRDYVTRASKGRLGYLHLDNMEPGDMSDFIRQYFPQRGKEGMVVDIRNNGGGYICMSILNILQKKRLAFFHARNDEDSWTRQSDYFSGPLACLINENNASCGEEFPYYFRTLGLGPLIGRRTWGGEVGSAPGWPLADGGVVNVPNYGAWSPENGWIIEQKGVSPDIDVENDPNLYAQGKDPQLDRAIVYLLGKADASPRKPSVLPAEPIRNGKR